MLLSGTCGLLWKDGKECGRLSARSVFMLMLLNSCSMMKGSLRDLIEVSVGQMRGFHPARQLLIHQTFTGMFLTFRLTNRKRKSVPKCNFPTGLGEIPQRTCCYSVAETQRQGEEKRET